VILVVAVVSLSGQTPKRLLALISTLISARVVRGGVKSDLTWGPGGSHTDFQLAYALSEACGFLAKLAMLMSQVALVIG
jgi:hypothetical protein